MKMKYYNIDLKFITVNKNIHFINAKYPLN